MTAQTYTDARMETIAARLDALWLAVAEGRRNEFTMRVPAEPDRDADLVLQTAADMLRIALAERQAARSVVVSDEDALAHFTDYFVRNYPGPNTIISDPKWHAPKIFKAAKYAIQSHGVAGAVKVPDGAALIALERQRQMSEEGWSSSHDAEHDLGELSLAALCYVAPPIHSVREHTPPLSWPWDESWWKPGDRIRELTKAGALIAAEIDRLAATQEKAS